MHAVAFTAGELADLLLLVGALEVEGAGVRAGIYLPFAKVDHVLPVGNLFPDVLAAVEFVARLVDVTELDAITDVDGAFVGLFLAGDHAEQRGLAGAVRADDANDAAW